MGIVSIDCDKFNCLTAAQVERVEVAETTVLQGQASQPGFRSR